LFFLFHEGKISKQEMEFRMKRDAQPHKDDFDNDILPLLDAALMV
jgi:hypothetical protein